MVKLSKRQPQHPGAQKGKTLGSKTQGKNSSSTTNAWLKVKETVSLTRAFFKTKKVCLKTRSRDPKKDENDKIEQLEVETSAVISEAPVQITKSDQRTSSMEHVDGHDASEVNTPISQLEIPPAANISVAQPCVLQSPITKTWIKSSFAEMPLVLTQSEVTQQLQTVTLLTKTQNDVLRKLQGRLEESTKSAKDLREKLVASAQDNLRLVAAFNKQRIEYEEALAELGEENGQMRDALDDMQKELNVAQQEVSRAQDYNCNLDRLEKDAYLRAAADAKAEAEHCTMQLHLLHQEMEGKLGAGVDAEKVQAIKNEQIKSLEDRIQHENEEHIKAAEQAATDRSELARDNLSLNRRVEFLESKHEILVDGMVNATANFEVISRQIASEIALPQLATQVKVLLTASEVKQDMILQGIDGQTALHVKHMKKLDEYEQRLEQGQRIMLDQRDRIEELEAAKSAQDVELMRLEVEHEILKKRARKTFGSKNDKLKLLETEVDEANQRTIQLGERKLDSQQGAVMRVMKHEVDRLTNNVEEAEKKIEKLREMERIRRHYQRMDDASGLCLENVYYEAFEKVARLEKFCHEHGLDPYAPSQRTLNRSRPGRGSSGPARKRESSVRHTMGSILPKEESESGNNELPTDEDPGAWEDILMTGDDDTSDESVGSSANLDEWHGA